MFCHLCPPWWHQAGCLWQAGKGALVQRAGSGEARGHPRWPEATPAGLRKPLVFLQGRPLGLLALRAPLWRFWESSEPSSAGFSRTFNSPAALSWGPGHGNSAEGPARRAVAVFSSVGCTDCCKG